MMPPTMRQWRCPQKAGMGECFAKGLGSRHALRRDRTYRRAQRTDLTWLHANIFRRRRRYNRIGSVKTLALI